VRTHVYFDATVKKEYSVRVSVSSSVRQSLISGVIGLVMGVGVTLIVGIFVKFPWSEGQTLIAVAIASCIAAFSGAMAGFGLSRR